MTRRKFTSKFKTKVVLEALKERYTAKELAQRSRYHPNRLTYGNESFYLKLNLYLPKKVNLQRVRLKRKKTVC